MATDSTQCVKKNCGRLKVFDGNTVLGKIMKLFWQYDCKTTPLADPAEATRAKTPTLYVKFTSKGGLFYAVPGRYINRFAARHEVQLPREKKSAGSALADYFAAIVGCFTSKDTPAGYFTTNNCTTLSLDSGDIANTPKLRHVTQERTLQRFLCQRQVRGEIPTYYDVTHLIKLLDRIIRRVSISACEGTSLEKLMQTAEITLCLRPGLVK